MHNLNAERRLLTYGGPRIPLPVIRNDPGPPSAAANTDASFESSASPTALKAAGGMDRRLRAAIANDNEGACVVLSFVSCSMSSSSSTRCAGESARLSETSAGADSLRDAAAANDSLARVLDLSFSMPSVTASRSKSARIWRSLTSSRAFCAADSFMPGIFAAITVPPPTAPTRLPIVVRLSSASLGLSESTIGGTLAELLVSVTRWHQTPREHVGSGHASP